MLSWSRFLFWRRLRRLTVQFKFVVMLVTLLTSLVLINPALAKISDTKASNTAFKAFYEKEWGQVQPCRETALNKFGVCSNVLRNEGNAPFILNNKTSDKVAVLVHGLSDSPFFMRAIADILFEQGFTVVVPLLPGHGKRDADDDMSDWDLEERWQAHVDEVISLADSMGNTLILGGFSTGGALSVEHYLSQLGEGKSENNSNNIDGLMLFSGALTLSENAEGMSRIWGIKLLARIIDGTYETHGPNPYKYPNVAGLSGLELMDLINTIRDKFEEGKRIDVPVFAAHSQADVTTPISGIENLMQYSEGNNTFFVIDESYALCHADVVVNPPLLKAMNFNTSMVNQQEECAVPQANPLFSTMAMMLREYVKQF